MVGDQHHTAASHWNNGVCGQYLWQNRRTKSYWRIFFSGANKTKNWPSQGKYSIEQKGRTEMPTKKDKDLSPWRSVEPRTTNTILGLRFQSLQEEKLIMVFQDGQSSSLPCRLSNAWCSAHLFSPREEEQFYQEAHSLAIWAVAFPFTHPSLTSHMFPNDRTMFLSRQRALDFFPQLNRWEIYNSFNSVFHLPSGCGLQCWNIFSWFSLKVQFHFSL